LSLLLEPFLAYTPYLALLVRVWIGGNLMIHGRPKLRKEARKQATAWMESMGVHPMAVQLVSILEFFGGIFLIIGLIVPIVSAFFAIEFAAIAIVKRTKMKAAYIHTTKPSYEIDILYLIFSIILVWLGAGYFSIDQLVGF
jgi:putative oxidoreductase